MNNNNKSLAPLIVSFAAIILLTFVVINFRPTKNGVDNEESELRHKLSLGHNARRKSGARHPPRISNFSDHSADVAVLTENAEAYLVAGNIAEAENALKTVLVLDPENKTALSLLGGIFFRTSRYSESEHLFERLAAIDQFKNPVSLNKLASALAKSGKLSEAIELCLRAQELDPDFAEGYLNASGIYAALGDSANSIKNMRRAYEILGHRVLAYSIDPVFDKVKAFPEFQEIITKAQKDLVDFRKTVPE